METVPTTEAEPMATAEVPTEPPVLPPAPEGLDADVWELLGELCPLATLREQDGTLSMGCRALPPWDGPNSGPDGRAPAGKGFPLSVAWEDEALKGTRFAQYVTRYEGSFTRPNAKQSLLFFDWCRPMDGITITGCAAIVERQDDAWRVVGQQREAAFAKCMTSRRDDGVDLLVCHNDTGAMMESITTSIFYLDFTKEESARRVRIGELAYNTFSMPCDMVPPPGTAFTPWGSWTLGIVGLEVEAIEVRDLDSNGTDDVSVSVKRAFEPFTPTLASRAQAICQANRKAVTDDRAYFSLEDFLPPRTAFRLQFVKDGDGLKAAKGTANLMKVWAQQHAPRPYAW